MNNVFSLKKLIMFILLGIFISGLTIWVIHQTSALKTYSASKGLEMILESKAILVEQDMNFLYCVYIARDWYRFKIPRKEAEENVTKAIESFLVRPPYFYDEPESRDIFHREQEILLASPNISGLEKVIALRAELAAQTLQQVQQDINTDMGLLQRSQFRNYLRLPEITSFGKAYHRLWQVQLFECLFFWGLLTLLFYLLPAFNRKVKLPFYLLGGISWSLFYFYLILPLLLGYAGSLFITSHSQITPYQVVREVGLLPMVVISLPLTRSVSFTFVNSFLGNSPVFRLLDRLNPPIDQGTPDGGILLCLFLGILIYFILGILVTSLAKLQRGKENRL